MKEASSTRSGKVKPPRDVKNEFGEMLGNYQWDGPDDSDEEI